MQDLLKEKQKADEEAADATKNTVIKVLMGEVQVNIYYIKYNWDNDTNNSIVLPTINTANYFGYRLVLLPK